MFENIVNFFKNIGKKEENKKIQESSKDAAKERLHLVLMQDRANVSADFLELMKQEIIEVIKKYIEVDEKEIDVRLTNKENEDGTNGAPALYANIPILNIKNDARKIGKKEVEEKEGQKEDKQKNKTENKQESKEKTPKNEKIKEEPQETKENEKENQQKEIEAKEKIQEIIDGVIEEAENNKTESDKTETNQEEQNNVAEQTNEEEQKENKEKVKSEN